MRRAPGPLAGWRWILLAGLVAAPAPPAGAADVPEWMERWEFGGEAAEDQGPGFFADLLVPIIPFAPAEAPARLLFAEPRLTYRNHEWLSNLGLGYRQVLPGEAWLLGANLFHDYQSRHAHYRLGGGLEALHRAAEFRANAYLGLSGERVVEETATTRTLEEAVDGFDLEAGMPIPYYSRLKLFGGYTWYDYERFKNRYGWTLRAEFTPAPFLVVDGMVSDDTKSNVDWTLRLAVRFRFGPQDDPLEQARSVFRLDDRAFPDSRARDHLYRLVERRHEIIVERTLQTSTVTVEVRRGT